MLAGYRAVEPHLTELVAAPNLMSTATRVISLSTYGGDVMPRRALDAIAAGAAAGIDVLIGTNRDEVMMFPPEFVELAPAAAAAAFGPTGRTPDEVFAAYRAVPGPERDRRVRLLTDTIFRIPAIRLAEAASSHGSRVYSYLLGWGTPATDGRLGALHGLDLPLMWNRLDDIAAAIFAQVGRTPPVALAEAMHGAWVSFVTIGVPQHPGLPAWPTYDTARRATMWLDDESRIVDDPLGEERALWADVRY